MFARRRTRNLLLCFSAFILSHCFQASLAYRVTPTSGLTHGRLIQGSISYLKGIVPRDSDNSNSLVVFLVDSLEESLDAFVKGQIDADYEGGVLKVFGETIPRNSISHFHNPETGRGFRAASRVLWVNLLESAGWLNPLLSQIRGPALSSSDMADWYYARAVYYLRGGGNATESMRSISYAGHMIQDATVPQHASDCGEEDRKCKHGDYENFVEERFGEWPAPSASYEQIQQWADDMTAGEMVQNVAALANPLLQDASNTDTMASVAQKMVPLAQEMNAALTLKFLQDIVAVQQNGRAATRSVVFQITSVELQGKLSSEVTGPDIRPRVWFNDESSETQGQTRGWFQDTALILPQEGLDAFGWTFVHQVDETDLSSGSVTVHLSLEEVEANLWCGKSCGTDTRQLALAPGGQTTLDVTLSLLETDILVEGTSDACEGQTDCVDSVSVNYKLGQSYAMSGKHVDLVACGKAMSTSGIGYLAAVAALCFFTFFFVILCIMKCVSPRISKRSKESHKSNESEVSPSGEKEETPGRNFAAVSTCDSGDTELTYSA